MYWLAMHLLFPLEHHRHRPTFPADRKLREVDQLARSTIGSLITRIDARLADSQPPAEHDVRQPEGGEARSPLPSPAGDS